jgi:putative ABC transport system permease protein
VYRRYRRLFRHVPDRPDQLARELDDEIASHLAARIDQLVSLGRSPDEAREEALRRFGDPARARQRLAESARRRGSIMRSHERAEEAGAMVRGLPQDARHSLRVLRLHPAFAIATVATLGLAIAAAVTAFSFVNAIFLQPLPAPAADRLVHVYLPRPDGRLAQVGGAGAALLRDQHDIFDRVAAERCCWVKFVGERGTLDQRYAAFASAEFFPMLGLTPALGRFFRADETSAPDREPVVVLSYNVWQLVFGGDRRVIGEHVAISGHDFTIIGVAPAGFRGTGVGATPSEIWLPSTMASAVGIGCTPAVPCDDMDVLARLTPGVSIARAAAGLERLGRTLSELSLGDDSIRKPVIVRATGALVATQRQYSPLARLLGAIAALLLIIACANLSGLLAVRGMSRVREIALRLSLGASRLRIMQQLLVESGALAIAGGLLGLVLSIWASRALMGFFVADSEGFENYFPIGLDARVVWFAIGISLLSTIAFGLLPAFLTARAEPADVLKSGTAGSGRARARFELVAVQVALTSALLSGAVLLSRSFARLLHAQRFDANHVALLRVRPAAAQYDSLRSERYVRAVAERLATLPQVERVAFARGVGFAWGGSPVEANIGMAAGDSARPVQAHFVSPGFFSTLRIPLLEGREFTSADGPGTPLVAMVSESLARMLAPTSDIVGRTLYARGKPFRVVGVVPDYLVHMTGERVPPMAFFAFWQNALGAEKDARFVVRVRGDPTRALTTLRSTAHEVDRYVPVAEVMTLAAQMDASYPEIRLSQNVLLAAGGLALLLSAIGLYGVIAFLVTRRTRDIGLRIALGALPARVAGQLIGRGMIAVVTGLSIGLGGAWMLSRLLDAWLVGITPHDLAAFGIAGLLVSAASLVACAIPARRAARIDPAIALRVE